MRYVISKIDSCDSASDAVKSVNILMAIRWAAKAWSDVTPETISKCFRKAGVLTTDLDVISCGNSDEDPFLEVAALVEIQSLITDAFYTILPKTTIE